MRHPFLPLPGGEGRGEGEPSFHTFNHDEKMRPASSAGSNPLGLILSTLLNNFHDMTPIP